MHTIHMRINIVAVCVCAALGHAVCVCTHYIHTYMKLAVNMYK